MIQLTKDKLITKILRDKDWTQLHAKYDHFLPIIILPNLFIEFCAINKSKIIFLNSCETFYNLVSFVGSTLKPQ